MIIGVRNVYEASSSAKVIYSRNINEKKVTKILFDRRCCNEYYETGMEIKIFEFLYYYLSCLLEKDPNIRFSFKCEGI